MILYGDDYYPEQWKEAKDILQEDLSLMKKAHCNTVTLGVFAWFSASTVPYLSFRNLRNAS